MAEALRTMANINNNMESLDLPTDPDAHATVTDFLDFTEYLPSDMIRSLTLIGNLDQNYVKTSANVDELTKTYGKLPELPADGKPDPVFLRSEISENLSEAVRSRTLCAAEAARMADNVDRHYNRAKNILLKLQAMAEAYPSSREPSPVLEKAKSPVAVRAPKITIRLGNAENNVGSRVRKHRAPRITVPGEVLAPYELDYESYGSETDLSESDDDPLTPRQTPARSLGINKNSRIKLKIQNHIRKDGFKSHQRIPRPPGVMGTNVHSTVAGISTSNALAMLKPPPPDAVRGSADAPWLALTEWELGMLRKRMKKNAVWSPSDTMIARELKNLNRGIENYRAAKREADAAGQPMAGETPPQLLGITVPSEGAISVDAVRDDQDLSLVNRGMKLNEAKKLKKEIQANQVAEAEKAAAEALSTMSQNMSAGLKELLTLTPGEGNKPKPRLLARKPTRTPAKKRKRDSDVEAPNAETPTESEPAVKAEITERPLLKRTKTETPVPAPAPLGHRVTKRVTPASASQTPAMEPSPSVTSEAAPPPPEVPTDSLAVLAPKASAFKASATALASGGESKKDAKKAEKSANVTNIANTRARRSSVAPATANQTPTPAPEPLPAKRPTSSRSKAASVEPAHPSTATATIDRPRRTSTARNTPAPPELRQMNKRTKRPAPGVVTSSSEGSTAVSVGKRSAATRKKAGVKKEKKDGREGSVVQENYEEFDDAGNLIDPGEARYCLCNRVSFGTMIGCENNDVCHLSLPLYV